ncbi:MATE efflux family protein [Microthyrium microscopicum]|uniref:MATE efflux family protein n=1 Tax=Microthyrium microscopicum TaxID=703497 RepID=A0A6A6UFA5_9PEZI|nr:MATE efflux family protein [Microthyrium microscopicum]
MFKPTPATRKSSTTCSVITIPPPVLPQSTESTSLLESPTVRMISGWKVESKLLGTYSIPLIIANLLQFCLNMSSLLVISSGGRVELGAVSIAIATANITGFVVFQGLSTSLDTLCGQACGSGNTKLARLHVQRMIILLGAVGTPIAMLWFFSAAIVSRIIPDAQVAILAGLYLRVLVLAIPGFVVFEAGKRILTSNGFFLPVTGILCVGACTNAFLSWLLVWRLDLGFIGAPIAVAATWTLVSAYLTLYLHATGNGSIWHFKTSQALGGWTPMLRLALPGLIMVEAEYFAFEVLTIASAQLSTANLAAQTILVTLNSAFWQIPFSISSAGTTAIAQHIGAKSTNSAKASAGVVFVWSLICSAISGTLFFSFRAFWPTIFTDDPEVVDLVLNALPLVAFMHLFDGLAACCNGILRGIGKPAFGGWVNLSCYYLIALPMSIWTAFGLQWGLMGLWVGVTLALAIVTVAEALFLHVTDWQKVVEDAVMMRV